VLGDSEMTGQQVRLQRWAMRGWEVGLDGQKCIARHRVYGRNGWREILPGLRLLPLLSMLEMLQRPVRSLTEQGFLASCFFPAVHNTTMEYESRLLNAHHTCSHDRKKKSTRLSTCRTFHPWLSTTSAYLKNMRNRSTLATDP